MIPQKLKRELRFGNRVLCRIGGAYMEHPFNTELNLLLCTLRRNLKHALNGHASPSLHKRAQIFYTSIHDNLKVGWTRPIVHLQECEGALPLLSPGLHPPTSADSIPGQSSSAIGTTHDGSDRDSVGKWVLKRCAVDYGHRCEF